MKVYLTENEPAYATSLGPTLKLLKKMLKWSGLVLLVAVAGFAILISYERDCPVPESETEVSAGMRAVTYRCYGSPDVLEISRIEKPVAGEGEILVRVVAAGVNPLDWHYMRGSPYVMRLGSGLGAPTDTRLGVDFAGVVESVGPGVQRFKPGDQVFGGRNGAFADYVLITESSAVAQKPDNISFEQAAAVGIAGVTALQALQDKGQLAAGQKVLINGASGGVGTFAVQMADAMGAEVTGVSSARNHELVRDLGADHVIDYKTQNYTKGEERYDLIVDMVGNHSPRANSRVLKKDGRLVMVGGSKGDWVGPIGSPLKAFLASPFIDQEMLLLMAQLSRDSMEELAGMIARGELQPVVDRTYPLETISEAIAYSESGRARGKIVITGLGTNKP
jgi:NADPH:quinone reductase-like Zn-dependent oxidoreductase